MLLFERALEERRGKRRGFLLKNWGKKKKKNIKMDSICFVSSITIKAEHKLVFQPSFFHRLKGRKCFPNFS